MKLFLSRFFIITFFALIFGIFQQFSSSSVYLTTSQLASIIPLFMPYVLFQFIPFIYLGTMMIVMNDIYSNNELVSFKSVSISHNQLVKIFFKISIIIELFALLIINLYPFTLKQYYQKKVTFSSQNIINNLKPKTLITLGNNTIIFRAIDKQNKIKDILITQNIKSGIKNDKIIKRIFFAKECLLGVEDNKQLIATCLNANINIFQQELENKKLNSISFEKLDIDLNELLDNKNYSAKLTGKNKIRSTNSYNLIKLYCNKTTRTTDVIIEFHNRLFCIFIMIFTMTAISSLLLFRQTNRIRNRKLFLTFILLGILTAISRSFILEGLVLSNMTFLFYLLFIIMLIGCSFYTLYKLRYKKIHK